MPNETKTANFHTYIILDCCNWKCNFLVFRYIDNKTDRLHSEIADSIRTLFEGQESSGQYYNALNSGFFDDVFSGCSVKHYKEIPIPNYSSSSFEKQLEKRHLEDWKDSYGDLSSLYLLNWGINTPTIKTKVGV